MPAAATHAAPAPRRSPPVLRRSAPAGVVKGVDRSRYAAQLRRLGGEGVVDLGYDRYVEALSAESLDYLRAQARGALVSNVEGCRVSQNYVDAFLAVLARKEAEAEAAPPPPPPSVEPGLDPVGAADEGEEEERADVVVRLVECGGKGQRVRVEVPRALDAGD